MKVETPTADLYPTFLINRPMIKPTSNVGKHNSSLMQRTNFSLLLLRGAILRIVFYATRMNVPEAAKIIGKVCVSVVFVLLVTLGALQAAPIVSLRVYPIRENVSKVWWSNCSRDHEGRAHCRRCWYGIRGNVHCTRDLT
jgi:hypothetical protein